MTARDTLLELFDNGNSPYFFAEETADDILKQHAHELAEKIRKHFAVENGCTVPSGYINPAMAANLIDPWTRP